ncbi:MAG: hypothetical protein MSS69_05720 [Spirochaetales bacterium]|nr:hypothetical protein [Spirochaetales bacterium]
MASKKDTLTLGYGCISCGHNKDINLYKDMYRMSTEKNADHAEEGTEFLKELKNNPPKRTRCRFYDSADGLLCEYFVERDYVSDSSKCPDYLEVKFEKAPAQRKTTIVETESNIEDDTSDMREVTDDENEDDEPLELEDEE